jgi:hypothetical protein
MREKKSQEEKVTTPMQTFKKGLLGGIFGVFLWFPHFIFQI